MKTYMAVAFVSNCVSMLYKNCYWY